MNKKPNWVRAGHPHATMASDSITGIRAWFQPNQFWTCHACIGNACITNTPHWWQRPNKCLHIVINGKEMKFRDE